MLRAAWGHLFQVLQAAWLLPVPIMPTRGIQLFSFTLPVMWMLDTREIGWPNREASKDFI